MSSTVTTNLDGFKLDYESIKGKKHYSKKVHQTASWSDLNKLNGFPFGTINRQNDS